MTKKHDIIWLDSVDSTNDEARRRISFLDNLSVLTAVEQTRGRGQRGNSWSSNAGMNLTFSIVMKFRTERNSDSDLMNELAAHDSFVLNEIVALSVAEFLSSYGISAQIKWPNDIYVDDKKICGILIENSLNGNSVSSSIIGIGLNINQRDFDVSLINPTSMSLCKERSYDISTCLDEFLDIFKSYAGRMNGGTSEYNKIKEEYLSGLWRKNCLARFIDYSTLPSGHMIGPVNLSMKKPSSIPLNSQSNQDPADDAVIFTGRIIGLSQVGNLMVEEYGTGHVREFGFKEIGYII